ncbi:hypothetical protein Leryth_025980 [Lithospermum erythrorhizon]|nr:hypothetical protein Leryth_025980 [Lithospermum erythrorhizon]
MALSNNVIGGINFIAMLLSIPIIGAGIWLTTDTANSCVKFLQWPVIILGVLILVVAIAGFIGAFWRIPWLLIFYLIAMLVLIILLACLVIFVYMVTIEAELTWNTSDDFHYFFVRIKFPRIKSKVALEHPQQWKYGMAQDYFDADISPITAKSSKAQACKPPVSEPKYEEGGGTFASSVLSE